MTQHKEGCAALLAWDIPGSCNGGCGDDVDDRPGITALLAHKPTGSKCDRDDYRTDVPSGVLWRGCNAVEKLRSECDGLETWLYRFSMDLGVAQSTIHTQAKEIQRLRDAMRHALDAALSVVPTPAPSPAVSK